MYIVVMGFTPLAVAVIFLGGAYTMGWLEDRDWRKRLGRFRDCDRDDSEHRQIMPGRKIGIIFQTHGTGEGEYHDGTPEDMDA